MAKWSALAVAVILLIALVTSVGRVAANRKQPCVDCAQPTTQASQAESVFGFAVFGDYPYTEAQRRQLPRVVDEINDEPDVDLVFHLGDIKGAGACTTAYYREIKAQFDRFQDPMIYTFGDNEWSDCSRPDDGGYQPLERLATLRKVFIPKPGYTLGQAVPVTSQAAIGLPENVRLVRAGISFGAFHAVGPYDGLQPWGGHMHLIPAQVNEEHSRVAGAVRLIADTFDTARDEHLDAVVLMTQADMFAATPSAAKAEAYRPIVQKLAQEAASFSGPVYLFNGDSHRYVNDHPLDVDSGWTSIYRVKPVTNLTRVTVDGDTHATDYLKVVTYPHSFLTSTLTRVPFTR